MLFPKFMRKYRSITVALVNGRLIFTALLLAAAGGVIACQAASAETFYVAPDGDDDHPGTLEQPLATLAAARDKVRRVLDGSGDVTVYFRGGHYRFAETVVFGLEDSGSARQQVAYKAYQEETPVFTSGVHVTGWRRITREDPGFVFLSAEAQKHVYVAALPTGVGLVRNLVDRSEDWLERARWGVTRLVTTKHFKRGRSVEGEMWDPAGEKSVQEYSKSLEGLSNADDALEVRFYPTDFNMNLLPVASIDGNRLTTQVPGTYRLAIGWKFFRGYQKDLCWLENLLEGLDAPGQWVCNAAVGKLYLWPKSGTDDIYAPTLTELVRVEGELDYGGLIDKPVQYLTFEGITFTDADRNNWKPGDVGIQHDWAKVDKANALLRFRGAEHCRVKRCRFVKSGGVGVRFDLWAKHNSVEACEFGYLGDEAVHFCGYGIGKKDANRENRLIDSEIHHNGMIKWDAPAIIVWNSGYNRIEGNRIHHCANKAVLLSAPRSRAFTRHDAMREQAWPIARWDEIDDPAALATIVGRRSVRLVDARDNVCSRFRYTRGNVVERNVIHNASENLWGDGIFYVTATGSVSDRAKDQNRIALNYIYNSDGGPSSVFRAVYLDGFANDVDVEKNVWVNCKFKFEVFALFPWFGEAKARANVFVNVSNGDDPFLSGRRATIEGNLFFDVAPKEGVRHDPRPVFVEDYLEIYRNIDTLPGKLAGKDKVKRELARVIEKLGGDVGEAK